MEENDRYQAAKKRVEDIKSFYIHLGLFVIVNLGLFAINMITNRDVLWFYWPLLGWGVAIAIHFFVFATEGKLLGPEWEDRKVHELMERGDSEQKKGA